MKALKTKGWATNQANPFMAFYFYIYFLLQGRKMAAPGIRPPYLVLLGGFHTILPSALGSAACNSISNIKHFLMGICKSWR